MVCAQGRGTARRRGAPPSSPTPRASPRACPSRRHCTCSGSSGPASLPATRRREHGVVPALGHAHVARRLACATPRDRRMVQPSNHTGQADEARTDATNRRCCCRCPLPGAAQVVATVVKCMFFLSLSIVADRWEGSLVLGMPGCTKFAVIHPAWGTRQRWLGTLAHFLVRWVWRCAHVSRCALLSHVRRRSVNGVMSGVLRGSGHQLRGFLINLVCFWLVSLGSSSLSALSTPCVPGATARRARPGPAMCRKQP